MVIDQSHKMGMLKHKFYFDKTNKYHGVDKKLLSKHKVRYLNLNSGDVVLFDPYLVHGTGKNYTNKIRWTFVARFNSISGIEYLKNEKAPLRIKQK